MGLKLGTYRAYCFDQAVSYYGTWVESELDKLQKQDKETNRLIEARKRKLEQILSPRSDKPKPGQFIDPAEFFK